jgi:protein involved in polysaccharide export with SLBB domain
MSGELVKRRRMMMRNGFVSVLLAAVLAACASPSERAPIPAAAPQMLELGEYRIEAGDEIEVRFPLNPEMNVRTMIRPDGRVSLQLVGEVQAEGRTPAELGQQLRDAYSTELRDPEVSVIVRAMAARVYVDGQIERPGGYPWSREITAMQAVARAGGFRDTADSDYVIVLRRAADGSQQLFEIRLDGSDDPHGQSSDLFLAPYDLVLVPESGVSDMNQWVDQYIRQNIPISPSEIFFGGF